MSSAEQGITAEEIITALNDRQLVLAYQPIINAQTREVNHFECLLRLVDETGEPRSAANMIIAAEQLGLCAFAGSACA